MKLPHRWHWTFHGKHPSVRDYFTIRGDMAMARAFIDWLDQGYQPLAVKNEPLGNSCSWRFWAKALEKDGLACGLIRSSCDAIGRPYPLLMVGFGPLAGWERNWGLLPLACENTWRQLEYISAKKYDGLEKLRENIPLIRPPIGDWHALAAARTSPPSADSASAPARQDRRAPETLEAAARLARDKEIVIALKPIAAGNIHTLIDNWHSGLNAQGRIMPTAVFMGGAVKQTFLAAFTRALLPADFSLLWKLSTLQEINK